MQSIEVTTLLCLSALLSLGAFCRLQAVCLVSCEGLVMALSLDAILDAGLESLIGTKPPGLHCVHCMTCAKQASLVND